MTLLPMLRFMEPPKPATWSVKTWLANTTTVPSKKGQEARDGLLAVVARARIVLTPGERVRGAVRRGHEVRQDVGRLALDDGLQKKLSRICAAVAFG